MHKSKYHNFLIKVYKAKAKLASGRNLRKRFIISAALKDKLVALVKQRIQAGQ